MAELEATQLVLDGGKVQWGPFLEALSSLPADSSTLVQVPPGVDAHTFISRAKSAVHTGHATRDIPFSIRIHDETSIKITHRGHPTKLALSTSPESAPLQLIPARLLPEILLDKLPDFDPDWPQSTRDGWFSAYEELVRILLPGRNSVIR